MAQFDIVPLYEADGNPIAVVEATGKQAALKGAAKGLGGDVRRVGSYQSWEYALRVGDKFFTTRRHREGAVA